MDRDEIERLGKSPLTAFERGLIRRDLKEKEIERSIRERRSRRAGSWTRILITASACLTAAYFLGSEVRDITRAGLRALLAWVTGQNGGG